MSDQSSRRISAERNPVPATVQAYEVRPGKDHRGVDLISDVLPFGRLWYAEANAVANAIGYAKHPVDHIARVYDNTGNVIETHEHADQFDEW